MDDILITPIIYQQRWLQRVETARERAAQHHATMFSGERQALHAWLHGSQGIQGGEGGDDH